MNGACVECAGECAGSGCNRDRAGRELLRGAFEDGQGALTHEIGEADENGFFAATNGENEIGVGIEFDVEARRAAFAAETREHSLE